VDPVRTLVGRRARVDRDLEVSQLVADALGELAHLIVPVPGAHVDREEGAAGVERPFEGPFDRSRHVAHVDERPPGRSVGEDRDPARGQGGGDEVVQHQIQSDSLAEAAGGREAQARDREAFVRQRFERLLGGDLRARVRGQRTEAGGFVLGVIAARPVDRAARREHERAHAGVLCPPRRIPDRHRVDLLGHLLERVAHRIVRDRGELDDGVDAAQEVLGRAPHVAVVLGVEHHLGTRRGIDEAAGEEARVEAEEGRVRMRASQVADQDGAHVPEVAVDQDSHFSSAPPPSS
jgi:hypothetical protein